MKLNLKNPILFFDIESTGLNVASDRIVEISALKLLPNGDQEIKTRRINPTIPISPEAQRIHGISNEDVADCPTFKEIAKSMANWMSGCDFSGYNAIKFDIPMLAEEFLRAGVNFDFRKRRIVDVQNIFHKLEQRTLSAAYKFYCNKELENAHSAEADTIATFEILEAQLDKYSDVLENDVKFLAEFSTKSKFLDYAGRIALDENDIPIINFGKHKGKRVESVFKSDTGYYSWMMNGDFTLDTKQVLTDLKIKFENPLFQ
ncbi:MAG: 3'-5' exonuclease [Bacteroidales bacterium]|jgi:DNA polymerase-3 subunit epsilon|nr:3'-5' exonuclease [Bacteroidales bacterium]